MSEGNSVVKVIGGGLSGCESSWQLAQRGIEVVLYESRPHLKSGAHETELLGELVCSNSLKTMDMNKPAGVLKEELKLLGSLIMDCAEKTSIPAGKALAVDRLKFSTMITDRIENHPKIRVVREEIKKIPHKNTIIATGPLTSDALSADFKKYFGDGLNFYDAIAPVVDASTIDYDKTFTASRWDEETDGDYINCPLNKSEYDEMIEFIRIADQVQLRNFEDARYFESCLPVEVMAMRGHDVLRFGPLRPVGMKDPHTGKRPWAVIQLRAENVEKTSYNLVGFQTRMKYGEQKKLISMIPALKNATILKYGEMHRNTYIDAPHKLIDGMKIPDLENVFVAGLLTGVEGYMESVGSGMLTSLRMFHDLQGISFIPPPPDTSLGAVYRYQNTSAVPYVPTNVNFGLWPPLEGKMKTAQRRLQMVERARNSFSKWHSDFLAKDI
ncbi:MAG: methylenetetrahydrofolate--tRNA-(uracil(54)-C(5))-methyltransferase (FADH(2)-oxidizing) TrmFO [Deltaproteobacteria bacterium]|nr:methylenetetrahydrofolate--tRNA-(uracil(54)-C(5))-methyltransferase (FADH(2)-oxidizing) TrmFO [Deltaproteobacteria bacterium]